MSEGGSDFGSRLGAAMAARGPLCVGIDPHPALLRAWGLDDDVAGLARFARIAVEALADRVAVVKPQSAFFERFGSRGVAVLETVVAESRSAGALVLLDVKRGDIGSTAQAYADAYLDPAGPLAADAITVTPFLGFGSVRPMIDTALAHDAGVFVLTLTSNPEGRTVQHARTDDGRTVAQSILDEIAAVNAAASAPGAPFGPIGAVVGATIGETGHDLTKVGGPFLAPGLGVQGGRPDDLRVVFGNTQSAVLPSYSREILQKGPNVDALRDGVDTVLRDCRALLGA
jgi:orotidine-5'-phosphate decarboxylase